MSRLPTAGLTLTLFMLWIFADNPDTSFSFNYLAFVHTFQAGVPELHGLFWIYLKSKNYTNLRNYGGVIHMARIAGVDLPREKRVEIGLTYIYRLMAPNRLGCFHNISGWHFSVYSKAFSRHYITI